MTKSVSAALLIQRDRRPGDPPESVSGLFDRAVIGVAGTLLIAGADWSDSCHGPTVARQLALGILGQGKGLFDVILGLRESLRLVTIPRLLLARQTEMSFAQSPRASAVVQTTHDLDRRAISTSPPQQLQTNLDRSPTRQVERRNCDPFESLESVCHSWSCRLQDVGGGCGGAAARSVTLDVTVRTLNRSSFIVCSGMPGKCLVRWFVFARERPVFLGWIVRLRPCLAGSSAVEGMEPGSGKGLQGRICRR
jgi:hypothetical protein